MSISKRYRTQHDDEDFRIKVLVNITIKSLPFARYPGQRLRRTKAAYSISMTLLAQVVTVVDETVKPS